MLIPVLHLEDAVQVSDLTRFNAAASIAAKGSANPINSVKIKAGLDGTDIELFNADTSQWFLDWVFTSQTFDIDSTVNKLLFKIGSTEYSTTVVQGTYTLASLLTAVKNAVEAVAPPLTVNFEVKTNNRIKLTPSNPAFSLVLNQDPASLFDFLQFKAAEGLIVSEDPLLSLPVEFSFKAIALTVASTSESSTLVQYLKLYTEASDKLFSKDSDLTKKERDIMKWTAEGRATFIAEHRATQVHILEWLKKNNINDGEGRPLTKWTLAVTEELRLWAMYRTLADLFFSFSNAVDDVFYKKSEVYRKDEIAARDRFYLTVDTNQDGTPDEVKDVSTWSGTLVHK
jgi:hypothetical protein